ncbi:hypothetical protein [Saccharicrinis sp. FJH54]|uniref:hypothetical protein n=1 Tax=Saccharicrinis sp. FJH54 TaxID=3344665 RepID=UPI0035D4B8E3
MKKITLILMIIFISQIIYCQNDTSQVSFVSYWSNGDSFDFEIVKIKTQWKADALAKSDTSRYIANFKVVDSTDTSYTIKWSFRTNLKSTYQLPDETVSHLSKYEITEVLYQTSELGDFIGIVNWNEIGEKTRSMLTDIFLALGYSDEETLQSIGPIISLYSTKEGVETYIFPELRYLHFPFGAAYSARDTIEYEENYPNLLGGDPIRGEGKLFFESVDFENDHCVLWQQVRLNPDDTKMMISQLLKQMGMSDKEFNKEMKKAEYDIISNNRFEYFNYPGIPLDINAKRESIIDIGNESGKRIDEVKIKLL